MDMSGWERRSGVRNVRSARSNRTLKFWHRGSSCKLLHLNLSDRMDLLQILSNLVISDMIKCFAASNFVPNLDKTNIMKFITKNIEETVNTKFLGLRTENHIHWKNHIEQMIPKLNAACYTIRSMVHISNIYTLKSNFYAYFCSIIKYGVIFWGNSSNSGKIFT